MATLADLEAMKQKEAELNAELAAAREKIAALETQTKAAEAAAGTPPPETEKPDLAKVDSFSTNDDPAANPDEPTEADHEGDVDAKIAAWKGAGNTHFAAQEYDEAIEQYTRCIKVIKKIDKEDDKAYVAIYANRSAAYLAIKKWVKASWDAQCAAKCDPTFWKAHWRHGVSLMAMAPRIERSTNAVKAFETCLPLAPENKKAEVQEALNRANIRLQEGKDRTPMPPQCAQS